MEKEKHLPMLRAIQEVKTQHYIGSEGAFRYLKDRRRWDDLVHAGRVVGVQEGVWENDEDMRRLIRGIIAFREELVLKLERVLGLGNEGVYSEHVFIPEQACRPSEDLFGDEISYVRRFMQYSGVYTKGNVPIEDYDLEANLQDFLYPLVEEVYENLTDDDNEDMIYYYLQEGVISALLAFAHGIEERLQELREHLIFSFDNDRMNILWGIFQIFIREDKNQLYAAVKMIIESRVENTEERAVDIFYSPEELYRRLEREQVLHDIWMQRELISSWVEKYYPANKLSALFDPNRIRSFEDAVSVIDYDIHKAMRELESTKELIVRYQRNARRLKELNELEDANEFHLYALFFGEDIQRLEGNIQVYEFIKTQLYRHKRFVEKFLDH